MPVSYQIIPQHKYPHQMTQINDNTEVSQTYDSNADVNALLCVFTSPKGRDNEVYTIDTGAAGFVKEYGLGGYNTYGQPLLNAYVAAASGAATVHCMRVMPDDSSYSCGNLIAKYKVDGSNMTVKFVNDGSDADLTNLADLGDCCVVSGAVDSDGYTAVKLFSVAYIGRGVYGKNIRWRLRSEKAADKENEYKNYNFDVYQYENGLNLAESFACTFVEDAMYSGASLYAQDIINDTDDGSNLIEIVVHPEGFKTLYDEYMAANPTAEYTLNDFDPLLGIDKYTKLAIPNYTIEPEEITATIVDGVTAISVASAAGVPLIGGSDGSLGIDVAAATRQATMDALYLKAYNGELDPHIKSKNRFPTTLILDANFPINVKIAIAALATKRTDCMAMLDCGLEITTKKAVKTYIEANLGDFINSRIHTIEPYCMKVRDPYTNKTITVTSTYWLSANYPVHFQNWNGKHRPFAGNRFGIIEGYIKNSIYPVFDEDLDSDLMDELAEMHVNFAKYNPNQDIVRAMQDTRQSRQTNLSEQNNMLIVLDIKRDAEKLCAQFEYDFSEADDIARFDAALGSLTNKYAAAQVRRIAAHFDKNQWEAERNIIHLYIEMVHKDLVRTTIIEIDVNRDTI